jgi:hypothetical protein
MHHWSCDWHLDQVPADCCCGTTRPTAAWFIQPEQARDLVRDAGKVQLGAGFVARKQPRAPAPACTMLAR